MTTDRHLFGVVAQRPGADAVADTSPTQRVRHVRELMGDNAGVQPS